MKRLQVKQFTVGPLQTNSYVIVNTTTNKAVVIDPGLQCDPLLEAIHSLRVTHILLTHAHFDHIGGVADVKMATNAPIWVHENERAWLTDATKNRSLPLLGASIVAPAADFAWQTTTSETMHLLDTDVTVLFTPGHSPGHVSFYWDEFVIAGDALFASSIGRTDLPEGDHHTLLQSIHSQLLSLPDATQVYPGHGPPTTIQTEKQSNPFLI